MRWIANAVSTYLLHRDVFYRLWLRHIAEMISSAPRAEYRLAGSLNREK